VWLEKAAEAEALKNRLARTKLSNSPAKPTEANAVIDADGEAAAVLPMNTSGSDHEVRD
jgi:hypothetical protein